MRRALLGTFAAGLMPVVSGAVTMEMVTVGDTNNPVDPTTGYGSVGHHYQFGKFEVYNSQYVAFLNAVADTDSFGLYNTSMSSDARGGIDRSGSPGSYTYAVKSGYENVPVVFVSFYDAVRFANWMENGQPTGAQGIGTTETGSYALFTNGAITTNASARGANVTWVIPTENEWYKAAYYDPGPSGPADDYWLYSTRSDAVPNSRTPNGTDANSVNFYRDTYAPGDFLNDGYAKTGSPLFNNATNYLTDVGSYTVATSYYGTFDQQGNVWEWTETSVGSGRILKGGSWGADLNNLPSTFRYYDSPTLENSGSGFRVAAIPKMPALAVGSTTTAGVRLTLEGSVGLPHVIEVSDNLTNWQPWASVTLPGHVWTTNVTLQPELTRRFWRAFVGH